MALHPLQQKIIQLSRDKDIQDIKLAELARLTGAYLQQVKYHRDILIEKNLLHHSSYTKKVESTPNLLGSETQLIRIPVLGSVNAGPASIYADGKVSGYLRISSNQLPMKVKASDKLYALRVEGDSMNRAKIGPQKLSADTGDYIIADGDTYVPETNDYVVSLVEGMANVKKLLIDRQREQVALVSESTADYPPILIDVKDDMTYLAQSKVLHVVKPPQF